MKGKEYKKPIHHRINVNDQWTCEIRLDLILGKKIQIN
jgi:hypothetical protein